MESGPSLFARQRHIGIYQCEICESEHRISGGRLLPKDAYLPLDVSPPVRGAAMRIHKLLGGPV